MDPIVAKTTTVLKLKAFLRQLQKPAEVRAGIGWHALATAVLRMVHQCCVRCNCSQLYCNDVQVIEEARKLSSTELLTLDVQSNLLEPLRDEHWRHPLNADYVRRVLRLLLRAIEKDGFDIDEEISTLFTAAELVRISITDAAHHTITEE